MNLGHPYESSISVEFVTYRISKFTPILSLVLAPLLKFCPSIALFKFLFFYWTLKGCQKQTEWYQGLESLNQSFDIYIIVCVKKNWASTLKWIQIWKLDLRSNHSFNICAKGRLGEVDFIPPMKNPFHSQIFKSKKPSLQLQYSRFWVQSKHSEQ